MIEAITIVLFLGFLAASIASIVGVVIGLVRKRWRFVIITSSATGVLFVLFVIAVNLVPPNEHDGDTASVAHMPTAIPEPTPIPEPTSTLEPTAVPEPSPTPYPTLGISSDKVQDEFELFFKRQGIEFNPTDSTSGNPAIMGVTESKHMALVLENVEGELVHAIIQLQVGGFMTDDDVESVGKSMMLLAELIVPEWDRRTWIQGALSTGSKSGAANLEDVHDGKVIKFIYTTSPTEIIIFSIEPELDDARPEQVEQVPVIKPEPTAVPIARGLGITRGQAIRMLAEFGYTFSTEDFCPEPCTSVSSGSNRNVAFWLHGPHGGLEKMRVQGNMITDSADTGIAMAELLHMVMPDSSDEVRAWLRADLLDSLDSTDGDVIIETIVMDGKHVQAEMHKETGKFYLSIRPGG